MKNPFKQFPFLLTLPLQVVMNFLLIVPFILAIYLSLTNWVPTEGPWWEAEFAGGLNYAHLFGDTIDAVRFRGAVANTLILVGGGVSLQFLIGMGLALAFFSWEFKGKAVLASVLLVPMMVVPAVTGFTFQTMFFSQGAVNGFISAVSGQPFALDWLSRPTTALLTIIWADTWQWTPFMFLLLYAGMTALPADPIRAARVLGASGAQIFRRLMLPQLRPIIAIALIIRSLEAFKIFDVPFIMTGGGPGTSTETISIYLYKFGIEFARFAYASSGALMVFVAILIVTIWASRPLMPRARE